MIKAIIGKGIEYVQGAIDSTKEILSTSSALIYGGILFFIIYSNIFPPEPQSSQFAALSDSMGFVVGIGLLLKKFWLWKIAGVFMLSLQIMNTSLMFLITMKNSATP